MLFPLMLSLVFLLMERQMAHKRLNALFVASCSEFLLNFNLGEERRYIKVVVLALAYLNVEFFGRQQLDFRPLKDGDPMEEHQITVAVRKRPLNKKGEIKDCG